MQQIIVYLFVKNNDTEKIAFNIIGRMMLNVYIIYIKIVDKKAMFPLEFISKII